jgi:hypothetical protein
MSARNGQESSLALRNGDEGTGGKNSVVLLFLFYFFEVSISRFISHS